jgi:clan AA aspartic protease
MGIVTARLQLTNPREPSLAPMYVEALADTGSVYLRIPEHVRLQLNLQVLEHREVTLADGSRRSCPYVGPVQLRFKNRAGYVGALVLGEQVLLGAIPMEDMDLVVRPGTRSVDVNPASPNIASGICMQAA